MFAPPVLTATGSLTVFRIEKTALGGFKTVANPLTTILWRYMRAHLTSFLLFCLYINALCAIKRGNKENPHWSVDQYESYTVITVTILIFRRLGAMNLLWNNVNYKPTTTIKHMISHWAAEVNLVFPFFQSYFLPFKRNLGYIISYPTKSRTASLLLYCISFRKSTVETIFFSAVEYYLEMNSGISPFPRAY